MFKNINKQLITLIILLVIYNYFFWSEKLGLNIAIFSILISAAVLFQNPGSFKALSVKFFLLAILYCIGAVLINNSFFSKFALIISLMLFTGFVHQPELKSLWASFLTYIFSYFMIPAVILEGYGKAREGNTIFRFLFNIFRLGIIPVFVCFIFLILYSAANSKFNFYIADFLQKTGNFLSDIFKDYPFTRFLYLFLGFILISSAIFNKNIGLFKKLDLLFLDRIMRNKKNKIILTSDNKRYVPLFKKIGILPLKLNSLQLEYRIGVILLVMVNILILALNIVDIKFLWLNFDPSEIPRFTDYVHQGAYLLIFSIFLSMVILLYLFRGNINFYQKNKFLKIPAYIWIVQNGFMALSVWLRNHYYIIYTHTISYKKTGVIIFLLLTFAGLVTMVLKIMQNRSTYNIIKLNSVCVFVVLLLMSSFNWDKHIAEYNLANPVANDIDIAYIFELSDDVLPELDKHKDLLNRTINYPRLSRDTFLGTFFFEKRKSDFFNEQNNYSLLSLNYRDYQIINYFKSQK